MEIKDIVKKLEDNPEFSSWKKENKESYLTHIFKMDDEANKDIWQIGYYNKDGTITTFVIEKDDIKIIPEEKPFQEKKRKIKKLNMKDVLIDFDEALKTSSSLLF